MDKFKRKLRTASGEAIKAFLKQKYICGSAIREKALRLLSGNAVPEIPLLDHSRKSWETLFHCVFAPLQARIVAGDGSLRIPGIQYSSSGLKSDSYESFSRSLFGFSLFYRGNLNNHVYPSRYEDALDIFVRGIAAGTDPDHSNYWGRINARQQLVETGILAASLLIIGDPAWNRLGDIQKKNTLNWFEKSLQGNFCDNNWQWFKLFHCVFLETFGGHVDPAAQRSALAAIERMYVGEGWYADSFAGTELKFDFYNPYIMHFFGLLFVLSAPESYRELKNLYRERARNFLNHYQYFFSPGAHQVIYGRSQLYNLAAIGIWGLAVFLDCTDVSSEWIKGCVTDAANCFLRQGAVKKDGLLSMGLYKDFPPMLENYSGPGSPYLNFEAFSFLLLPEDHPFWQIAPAGKPWRGTHRIRSINAMVVHDGCSGISFFPAGTTDPGFAFKYDKFAYHNNFIFDYNPSCPVDNALIVRDGNGNWSKNRDIAARETTEKLLRSTWVPSGFSCVRIISTIIPFSNGYKAVHVIDSETELSFAAGGFVLADDNVLGYQDSSNGRSVFVSDNRLTGMELVRGPGQVQIWKQKGLNAAGKYSFIPVLEGRIPTGRSVMIYKVWCCVGTDMAAAPPCNV